MTKTAFIAIVGCPNVGKSSILNRLLGQKIAIVSDKPQTTRTKIMGVLTEGDTQLVFTDTPGFHRPRTKLGEKMVQAVSDSVSGVDACLFVVEPEGELRPAELELIEKFKKLKMPVILAINKVDTLPDKEVLMARILEISKTYAEIIREKLLRNLDREIPHGVAVSIEKMREREDSDIMDIEAVIYCEKDSHKGIIIGKNGAMLKRISTRAREDMEKFFQCHINLRCWVKVKEGWRNREGLIHNFGLD